MLSPQAAQIRRMFSSIARRYDLLNHLLSLNIDRSWRREAVTLIRDTVQNERSVCLDLCCGTGDLSFELMRTGPAVVISSDFSHPMLQQYQRKLFSRAVRASIIEADALQLPFRSDFFDLVTIAFGLRNLESVPQGLAEIRRVLKPGGKVVVLEFSKPKSKAIDMLFTTYFFQILPRIGRWISGNPHAYSYLPISVAQFADQGKLCQIITETGFENVTYRNLSGGIAAIHCGEKTPLPRSH